MLFTKGYIAFARGPAFAYSTSGLFRIPGPSSQVVKREYGST